MFGRYNQNRTSSYVEDSLKAENISCKKSLVLFIESIAFKLGISLLNIKKILKNRLLTDENKKPQPISKQTLVFLSILDFSKIVRKKLSNYTKLIYYLKDIKKLYIPFPSLPLYSIPQVLPIWSDDADILVKKLRDKGIESYKWPGEELPYDVDLSIFNGTKQWVEKGVMLPIHHSLNDKYLKKIAITVKEAIK